MLLYFGILIGALVPFIWISYLRKIDVFEKEKIGPVVLVFILSSLSPFLINLLHTYLIQPTSVALNGDWLNDFLYAIFVIALPEEVVKISPIILLFFIKRKLLNEPFDFILYASVAALAFSFHENIIYIYRYGYGVIAGRSIISSPFHMFCSAIFIYGYVKYKFDKNEKNKILKLIWFPFFAVLSHGIFDFFLIADGPVFMRILSLFYFVFLISIYAVIINNSINQSTLFTQKIVIDSTSTSKNLLNQYFFLLLFYIVGCFFAGDEDAIKSLLQNAISLNGLLIVIMVLRLTRLKLIEKEWLRVKFEFPIYKNGSSWAFNGDGFDETVINQYLEEKIELFPFPVRLNPEGKTFEAYLEKKLQTVENETCYLVKVFKYSASTDFEYFILNPKKGGITEFSDKNPIAALCKIKDYENIDFSKLELVDFPFVSWVKINSPSNI